ncbi:hypothetical protein ABEB36_010913 [Hypothenemus hampei]|uniref:Uncharacterized protein n=1 Tax=Hypothenemus hampei TaxID=57062 RepID=A0ABD1EDK1_HYPHA
MKCIFIVLAVSVCLSFVRSFPNNPDTYRQSTQLKQKKLSEIIEDLMRDKERYRGSIREYMRLNGLTLARSGKRCANFGDDGCGSAGVPGAGSDSDWIGGGFTPGKRCANFGDDGCANGGIPGANADQDWLDGGFSPGKRCANLGDEGCANGGVEGAGSDADWLNGNFNPGRKR